MWTFFPWLAPKEWQPNTTEWCIPYTVIDPKICRGVCGLSQTWHPLPELPGGNHF
jgi:hypothetical protein